jgi:hypothetical protein
MIFNEAQQAAALLAAFQWNVEEGSQMLSPTDVPAIVGTILAAIPADAQDDTEESPTPEAAQADLADTFTRFLEIAAGQRRAAVAAGFGEHAAEMMAASVYGTLLHKL